MAREARDLRARRDRHDTKVLSSEFKVPESSNRHPSRPSRSFPNSELRTQNSELLRPSRQSRSAFLLIDQRRDLQRFLNQAIARIRLQGHRQHTGVDDMHRDNLKSFSDFVSLHLYGMADFEFSPNRIF